MLPDRNNFTVNSRLRGCCRVLFACGTDCPNEVTIKGGGGMTVKCGPGVLPGIHSIHRISDQRVLFNTDHMFHITSQSCRVSAEQDDFSQKCQRCVMTPSGW